MTNNSDMVCLINLITITNVVDGAPTLVNAYIIAT